MNIKFLKTKKKFKKRSIYIKPDLYWELTVCAVCVLALTSFFFGYQIFMTIDEKQTSTSENGVKKEIIKKERLENALEYFAARKNRSSEILNSPSLVVDPSW